MARSDQISISVADSPYRSLIDNAILRLAEDGKIIELKKKWWKVKTDDDDDSSSDSKVEEDKEEMGLSMKNVGGVFFVLVVGCGVGLLIGVVEFLWNLRHVAIENKVGESMQASMGECLCFI